jgi:alanyl-tRNA synthetase
MPYDLLEDVAEKHALKIDEAAFEALLNEQRDKSRQKTKIKGEIFTETFAKKVEMLGLKTEFLGYEKSHADAKVVEVMAEGEVILDRTPFYGESGGQVGDWGSIETPSGKMEVEDAKKIGQTIVHVGKMLKGVIRKGETAKVMIDDDVRADIMANHTATHLLQAALRKVLGEHVKQTGSYVSDTHLRFDFTHIKKMEERELARVEEMVNESILKSVPVSCAIKSLEEAKRDGAMALFGEKYDNTVRVVTIGDVSKELCGGTHAKNTGDIGIFKIVSESSIASGVRRIEAMTGDKAVEWIEKKKEDGELRQKMEAARDEAKRLEAEHIKLLSENIDIYIGRAKTAGDSKIVVEMIDGVNMEGLRALTDKIRAREKSGVVVLASGDNEKASFAVYVTDDIIKKGLKAGDIAKELSGMIDGSGGGKPNFAQGGGKSPAKLRGALDKILAIIKEKIS